MLAVQPVIQKNTARLKFHNYRQKNWELAVVTFLLFSRLSSEGKLSKKIDLFLKTV